MMIFSVVYLGILLLPEILSEEHWGYEKENGPKHWGKNFPTCLMGKHQSPINIKERNAKNVRLPRLRLSGTDIPYQAYVTNNGHSVMLKTNDSNAVMLSGGPLRNSVYELEQFHFHWGKKIKKDYGGSEHLINNHRFSMEMHAVFRKKDYKSMEKALNHSDGLAVLACVFKVCQPNPTYQPIVEVLPGIKLVGTEQALQEPLLLRDLIPNDIQNFFTYLGSLTTPGCAEAVRFIIFAEPIPIGVVQVSQYNLQILISL
ncbi:PREDICTED: carbonic anhydrase 2-like [Wasmannia auropunctata]|uniref:carbonic anhydrase 2-like n=1 Tax=Wasmannia auropunctata TaxID=64793 RepID=UPI0005F0B64D|nr:PREDICTED: carbonic anhydrase 2-like [Wasmannia auropunctata]